MMILLRQTEDGLEYVADASGGKRWVDLDVGYLESGNYLLYCKVENPLLCGYTISTYSTSPVEFCGDESANFDRVAILKTAFEGMEK